jgi:hypothetical protein
VYAGGGGATALYKSVNGGVDFSGISSAAEVGGAVAAIGLNPADPTAQDLEVSNGLNILHSSDGGGSWTVVHDPTVSRAATIHDIEYPPAGGAMAPEVRGAALATPSLALVGTGAGAFEGDISAMTGLMAASGNVTGTRIGNQITTVRSDSQPSLATAPASGRGDAVFRRSNGLYLTSARDGSWSLPSLIPGTRAGDEYPAVARAGGGLYLAFARTGVAPGIYVATRNFFGVWSLPKRVSTGSDTRPAIALTGSSEPKIHVAFLRTVGSARGVFHVTNVGGGWHTAKRIPGSTPADSDPALGGPVLQAGAENLRLAFARAGITPGIYYATTPIGSNPSWSELKRVTSVAGDVDPALAIDQTGVSHIVFRRSTGSGPRGLFALRGPPWSLQRVPATIPVDREPSLVEAGSSLILSFARPSTIAPGVYIDRETAAGDWLAKPRRWSSHATDRTPSVGAHTGGRATVLFQRR